MNSVSENITEQKPADDMASLEAFAKHELTMQVEQSEDYSRCFDTNGEVIFENVTDNDILQNKFLYEYIFQLVDEVEIQNYISDLRQVAKKYKLAGDFDRKVKPYRSKALKILKAVEQEQRIEAFNKRAESFPEWWDGQTIDEDIFCKCLLENREIKCINGLLYDVNGLIDENAIENKIYSDIKYYCKKDIAIRANKILKALKTCCFCYPLEANSQYIHVQNGTLKINGSFTSQKQFCTCRLNVNYMQEYHEPQTWIKFLNDLLEPQDILTLQEYMGYCLIPSTKAQKMLMIIGKGGEGKSRIGVIMQNIFGFGGLVSGQVMDFDNTSKAKYARAKLVSRLVFLDDDLDLEGLAKTSFLKQLITAEIPLEVEDKYKSSYQTWLYTRVIAFGNGAITSLYDKSDGFYRRQIILTAKPKSDNRKDDKFLSEKLIAEKDSIFMWCFEGLQRLIKQNFDFTLSDKAIQNLEESRREGCNIIDFMESKHEFCFDKNGSAHSRELMWAYEHWCSLNNLKPSAPKTFTRFLRDNADKYGIEYNENTYNHEGKRARGFKGIKFLGNYKTLDTI